MTPEELVESFSLDRVGKSGARFDPEKAKWINQQHIKMKTGAELAELLAPTLEAAGFQLSWHLWLRVCELMKDRRCSFLISMSREKFLSGMIWNTTKNRRQKKKKMPDCLKIP